MRKFVKLMTITTIAATTALQVTACKDDSKFDTFISDVNTTFNNKSAFFGFLGSADDETSSSLQDTFDYLLNQKSDNGKTHWENWIDEISEMLTANNLKTIYLHYYQGPYHQNKPSDVIDSFWNDKSISWQQNIFTWVNSRANSDNNPNFKTPSGVSEVTTIETKKDGNNNDMFTKLPIVFIVANGQLITAGENWIPASSTIPQKIDAVHRFILSNLFYTPQ